MQDRQETVRNFCPSFGPKKSKIVIVGEAPGIDEILYKKPFCGSSGQLLEIMLSDVGIDLNSCYRTNLMKTRPSNNDFSGFYLDNKKRKNPSRQLLQSVEELQKEIKEINPNVILALGNEPLKWLTGNIGISKHRGHIHKTSLGKLIPTYHPAGILRNYSNRPIAQIDLRRLALESTFRETKIPQLFFDINPCYDKVMTFLHSEPKTVSFDIETLGHQIRCIGFADSPTHAICIPFMSLQKSPYTSSSKNLLTSTSDGNSYWTSAQEKQILLALSNFLLNDKIDKIAQNAPFDTYVLQDSLGLAVRNLTFDTMAAFRLCYPELPMNLDFLTSVYTRLPFYSDHDAKSDSSEWTYNSYDCISTFQIAPLILEELISLKLDDLYYHHIHPLNNALTQCQTTGVLINVEKRKNMEQPLLNDMKEIENKISERVGKPVNPQSPKQVKEALKTLGYRIPHFAGKETTNARKMEELATKHTEEPFFRLILTHRQKRKLFGTYVTAKLDPDNRMRCSYNASGTVTGRLSSSKTIWDTGGNLQNIPKSDFRQIFTVPEDCTFVHGDLKQAEARAVAWLSKDFPLIEKFLHEKNFDIHKYTASKKIYNISVESVSPEQRQRAKACVHAGNYGIQAGTFAYTANIPKNEAKGILEKYQSSQYIQSWWETLRAKLQFNRTLTTSFGRIRTFYGRLNQETYRQAYAYVPQSTIGDLVNRCFYLLNTIIDKDKARLILQVHDEIDAEVKNSYVDEFISIFRTVMRYEINVSNSLPPLIVPLEISIGKNWWDLEEI